MERFASIGEAQGAVARFALTAAQDEPQELLTALTDVLTQSSPVDRVVGFIEAIYAKRDEASKAARDLALELSNFATSLDWHRFATSGRGVALAGPISSGKRGDDDPAENPRFTGER